MNDPIKTQQELTQHFRLYGTIKVQQELIQLLENQVMDLVMMSKIELGDDVIAEINRLQNMLMEMEEQELWDQTLMDGLEDETNE